MSAMANTTSLVTIVTKPATNPRDTDTTHRVNIQEFCEEYYEDILPIIMDKVRQDWRKDVHTRLDFGEGPRERAREDSHHSSARAKTTKPERVRVQDRLRYDNRRVLDRLGYRRQSAFDRLSKTYSPSTTKSHPQEADSRDTLRGRNSTHGLNTSREDRLKDREHFRSIRESYDDSFSHSCRDGNRSRHRKRRDTKSPSSSASRSDSSDEKYRRDEETIEDFMKRFKAETGRMKEAPDWEAASASKKKGHVSWKAHDQSKSQNSNKRSDFRGHSREGRGSNRFTALTRTPKEILAAKASMFQSPRPMVTPVEKRSSNKFCDFYNDKGHSTNECMQLKKQIEELMRA
nr:reverse transcriptase domain-containing protein [Tanacetum cinerariifolium]